MSSRIEIEITSQRNEEEWTWRAAGAKQPKGVLPSSILHEGAKVGDVLRAEADFEIDGITILSVTPLQAKKRNEPTSLQVLGPQREFQPVTSSLVAKSDKRRARPTRDGQGGDRRPPRGDRGDRERGDRDRGERGVRGERPERSRTAPRSGERPDRGERPQRPGRPPRPETPTYKRLSPRDVHRKAVLEQLPPDHRPIAEQVLRGGIPAVRTAIEAENTRAKAEGRPEVNSPALVAMAEEILPQLKAAEWMDRATAAKENVNEISVRDLRAVVTSADVVARTDEARLLASELRESLERRTNEERERWINEISGCLDENRVIRALRLSARPPDPQTKFPPELLERLKTSAEEVMSPDTPADRWITVLDAVANSPIRRNVEPKGLPAQPNEALLSAAKQAAGRIPALAKQLGVTMPPPPRRAPKPPAPQPPAPPTAP